VYVTTKPTELITFNGQPDFIPILGTRLLYAENTTANVFKSLTDQRTYVLLAGRWFSAPSLDGPWQFVPGTRLPSDFANISDSSPKENVKACVPGTTQAAEALIANSIPQSTAVARSTSMPAPQTDGPPQLLPIEGTPLYYVANSATPIIRISDQSWYACQNGVWFTSSSVNGPWTVATSIPPVIYTIPVTSPLHYLTYVRVYGATPESVYEGYTPGYLGTEVSPDGTVVYGTGYPYPPWIGDDWYGGPPTWGYGWDPFWTPWDDWGFAFGFGWGCGYGRFGWWRCHPPVPGWGAFHHHGHDWAGGNRSFGGHGWATTSGRFYGRPGFAAFSGQGRLLRGGPTFGRAYNSRTGTLVAGGRGDAPRVEHRMVANPRSWSGLTPPWRGGGSTLQRPSAVSRGVYPGGSFGREITSIPALASGGGRSTSVQGFGSEHSLPFSSAGSAGTHHMESRTFSARPSPSAGGRGAFSYGGEAFSFPHSGGGLGFSHSSGSGGSSWGGFSHSNGRGTSGGGGFFGFSHGSGGGWGGSHGGGGFSGGGGHGGGFSGGGGHGGGGGHR
jgi:hypothetical protein